MTWKSAKSQMRIRRRHLRRRHFTIIYLSLYFWARAFLGLASWGLFILVPGLLPGNTLVDGSCRPTHYTNAPSCLAPTLRLGQHVSRRGRSLKFISFPGRSLGTSSTSSNEFNVRRNSRDPTLHASQGFLHWGSASSNANRCSALIVVPY